MSDLHRAPEVAVERVGETAYLAPLPDGPITVLEGAALVVWDAVSGGGVAEIVDRVAESTGEDAPVVRDDVEAFLRTLKAAGLVREG